MDAQRILPPSMVQTGCRKPRSIVINCDAKVVLTLRLVVDLPRFS